MDKNKSIDNWDGFLGEKWLKAETFKTENLNIDAVFIVTGVDIDNDDLVLKLEHNNEKYSFGVNVTNANKLKEKGILTPKDCIGREIKFKFVETRNPQLNKTVEGLRIL